MKKIWMILFLNFVPFLSAEASLLPVGSEAKRFLNLDLQNKHVGLHDYVGTGAINKGKVVVLSFWSLSCVPCRKEMPLVQAWAQKNQNKVELFFINIDQKANLDKVRELVVQNKYTAKVLLDFYQTTAKAYGVCDGNNCSVPALYVVDADGMIRYATTGFHEDDNLTGMLDKAAFGPKPALAQTAAAPIAGTLPANRRLGILHSILVGLDHQTLATKYGLTREQLVGILKDAEDAAKGQWEKH
ncbi:MAG TPA: TlpA disulfide reductase family protein [Fibrobacteraceae bacterium]|nr:TlpA disulfide reductase family protein [Fibrobacteraceae bacterium]